MNLLILAFTSIVGILQIHAIIFDRSYEMCEETKEKLLIIMLDGFRWDYYDMHKSSLPGMGRFLSQGVQAEWVEPIFPSLSYPSWTTISAGVYVENHGIVGNYMLDLQELDPKEAVFNISDNDSTSKTKWWQNSEPIWTTATKYNKKTFLSDWSRCEVPFHGIIPFECTGYDEWKPAGCIQNTLSMAGQRLTEDFDLVMVYDERIDLVGHKYGPNSPEIKDALIYVDGALKELLDHLEKSELTEKVNIIIVSDHGMAATGNDSGVQYINLSDHIQEEMIYRSVGNGAVVAIAPLSAEYCEQLYTTLKQIPGIDVYRRDEIPEEFHYKKARLVLDLLLVAKKNYIIRGLQSAKQIPKEEDPNSVMNGLHGYATEDMRTIFFAKGPTFKKGIIHPPIRLEDEYQIFAKLLNIPAQPHNGSWSRVSEMFINPDCPLMY